MLFSFLAPTVLPAGVSATIRLLRVRSPCQGQTRDPRAVSISRRISKRAIGRLWGRRLHFWPPRPTRSLSLRKAPQTAMPPAANDDGFRPVRPMPLVQQNWISSWTREIGTVSSPLQQSLKLRRLPTPAIGEVERAARSIPAGHRDLRPVRKRVPVRRARLRTRQACPKVRARHSGGTSYGRRSRPWYVVSSQRRSTT